jgi:hypothetical protein
MLISQSTCGALRFAWREVISFLTLPDAGHVKFPDTTIWDWGSRKRCEKHSAQFSMSRRKHNKKAQTYGLNLSCRFIDG